MNSFKDVEPLKFKSGESYNLAVAVDDLNDERQLYFEQGSFSYDEAIALRNWLDSVLDDGTVRVPAEPTLEMCNAAQFGWENGPGFPTRYRAMIAAAGSKLST